MSNDRVAEVKARVEALKCKVREQQDALPELRLYADAGNRGAWAVYQKARREWQASLKLLSEAKVELVQLSGTGHGGDQKWRLIHRAWALLTRMQEAGTDIGEEGQALIDDIEFHVPVAKLQGALDEAAVPESPPPRVALAGRPLAVPHGPGGQALVSARPQPAARDELRTATSCGRSTGSRRRRASAATRGRRTGSRCRCDYSCPY